MRLVTVTLTLFKRMALLFILVALCLTLAILRPYQSRTLHFSRFDHIAVLLNDGKVLVAGGRVSGLDYISPIYYNLLTKWLWASTSLFYRDDQRLMTCEIFDPSAGTWKRTGDLIFGDPCAGLLLNSGKVFVGGFTRESHPEIYDPSSGKWELAPDSTPLVSLIRLPGPKGLLENGINSFTATVVDLNTGNWSQLDTGKQEPTDSLFVDLAGNKILWAHGTTSSNVECGCSIFNLSSLQWTSVEIPQNTVGFRGCRATLLNGGDILTTGGPTNSKCKLFDSKLYHWRITGQPLYQRLDEEVLPLSDGQILACGGRSGPQAQHILADSEIFDCKTETWHLTGALNQLRFDFTAILLKDGRVLVAGGLGGTTVREVHTLNNCELYDPVSGKWTLLQ